MQDHEIVAAIVAGDSEGLAVAYNRHAASLYAYCHSLLGEPADASDAVQDTFLIAAAKLGGLRNPARFRPWLYAVARNECLRRIRSRARSAPLEAVGEVSGDTTDIGNDAERADLRALVASALGGLNDGDREIIELNLRHELDGADLASALGVSRNQAHALASRARDQFEKALGTLLVARSGQASCPELATILTGWDGNLTVLLRKRVNRHIQHCETCGDRKRRELSPAMLLSMLPVVALPGALRHRVMRLVADTGPAATSYRAQVSRRAEPFSSSGFPEPLAPLRLSRWPKGNTLAAGAAAVALVALSGGSALALEMHHRAATDVPQHMPGSVNGQSLGGQPRSGIPNSDGSRPARGGSDSGATQAVVPPPVSSQPVVSPPVAPQPPVASLPAPTGTIGYRDVPCLQGYVWREAFAGDYACVVSAVRAQAVADNAAAVSRIEPGGGAYGPYTCKQGYVWRQVVPDDYACVVPAVRAQAAADNAQADNRAALLRVWTSDYTPAGASSSSFPEFQVNGDHFNFGQVVLTVYNDAKKVVWTVPVTATAHPGHAGGSLFVQTYISDCTKSSAIPSPLPDTAPSPSTSPSTSISITSTGSSSLYAIAYDTVSHRHSKILPLGPSCYVVK